MSSQIASSAAYWSTISPTYKATGIMKLATIAMKGIVTDKTASERPGWCLPRSPGRR
jgi:hypothetical protein